MSVEDCCDYFRNKFSQWDPMGNIGPYVRSKGKVRLSEEFRQDPSFVEIICSFISAYAEERQAAIVINTIRRVINPHSLIMDTLVAAILMACGHTKQGENMLKLIIGSALFLLVADAVYELTKNKRKVRKRSKKRN
jgi:hypothetical protein